MRWATISALIASLLAFSGCDDKQDTAKKTTVSPREVYYQSRGHSLQKQARLKTPSSRFPLLAGGTEPVRGSPREAGGTCRRGGNCKLRPRDWYTNDAPTRKC
jgi:hypothetical protein